MEYLSIGFSLLFDPLSLFFLAVIALVSVPSAVYSAGYLKGDCSRKKTVIAWALMTAFVLSMALVVTAGNAFLFLVAWELMSLLSYFLVVFDYKHERSVTAGTIYIVMTHIGTAFITAAFLIIYKYAGSFEFAAFKQACLVMPGNIKSIIFLFLLAGFGTKAGIVPLHIWLPYAHPQAPSHISSIMSGVMIKTAIYGLIRFVIFILGVNAVWWGSLVLVLAVVSCLVGVIYAVMASDLKKLLAYSSVENIGIILLGVGASMVFAKMGKPELAVFSLCAGLFHLLSHAVFKGLLFLGAGAVYKATGTRNMEHLGGLIKTMPWTAATFLVGAMAISALPPLSGFVSEWLTLQAFFLGALNTAGSYKIFLSICAAMLALTGGLAASCFVKAFGITFLAAPRSARAAAAKEVSLSMKSALVFMSLLTIAIGLSAPYILKILVAVSGCASGIDTAGMNFSLNNFTLAPAGSAAVSAPMIALAVIFVAGTAAALAYFGPSKKRVSEGKTWGCGYYELDSRTEYSATAFSKPFRIAFSFFLLPYSKTEKIRESFYHVKSFRYEVFTTPVFRRYIYDPALKLIIGTARTVRKIQPGSIHVYIAYIFITILALIIFVGRP
ncbi:MAG: proton-conducting transporter membrane subunit [Candidatus Omnitrophota bacterium]|jgi:hydrogenase-4 component B